MLLNMELTYSIIIVDSNKAYGVLSQQTFAQQELVSQMYMYDYPINEVEAQVGISTVYIYM